ncbi:hypothetical protein BSNK01_31990 [Bacillaceae bacterium]
MALTNYLLQSLVFTTFYYGYGFGWYGRTGTAQELLLAAVFFVLQVVLSGIWFKRFRFGPLEWLWRALTYGQRPRLKKEPDRS